MNLDTFESTKKVLSALSLHLGNEETILAALQSMIAAEITGRRIEMKMTQKDLAHVLNVSQSTLSKWESGETNFTLSTLVFIATKLDIEVQSPFVSAPPKTYHSRFSNIVAFYPAGWTTASSPVLLRQTETQTAPLLMEK